MEVKPVVYDRKNSEDRTEFDFGLEEKPSGNRHSFTLESNGYRLMFREWDDLVVNFYCEKFAVVSYDQNGDYAYLGIGKRRKNDCQSFADGVEKEMILLQHEKEQALNEIAELKRKVSAIDDFLSALPKVFLEDGVDFK